MMSAANEEADIARSSHKNSDATIPESSIRVLDRSVSIAVSLRGIFVLERNGAGINELLFFGYLWDLEQCEIMEENIGTDMKDTDLLQYRRLMININGCKCIFVTKYAEIILNSIETAILQLLSGGIFPFGTAGML